MTPAEARRQIAQANKVLKAERKARQRVRPVKVAIPKRKPTWGRKEDPAHLAAIRQLPCVATWLRYGVLRFGCDAAHVRYSSAPDGVTNPGKGVKPDDWRTVPLTREEHRSQHDRGDEAAWWADLGVNPYDLSRALYAASPDIEPMTAIIKGLRMEVGCG